jgi:DNA-binding NtrC family response regulator
MAAKTVLIVDDDEMLRRVLCTAINWCGFQTLDAGDGEEAWRIYTKERPAVVIADIYMPKMNGLLLLRHIRRYEPDAKVVLITGGSTFRQLAHDPDSRPDGFLQKPFSVVDIMEIVRNLTMQKNTPPRDTAAAQSEPEPVNERPPQT